MKVDIKKFLKMLEMVSVDWEIDTIYLDFSEDGIVAINSDPAMTILSILKASKSSYPSYEPIGRVVISNSIVKRLKKMFRADEYVDMSVESDQLVFKGASEYFTTKMPTFDRESLQIETVGEELWVKKIPINGIYQVDLSEIADVVSGDTVSFKFTKDNVYLIISEETSRYEKVIKPIAIKMPVEREFTNTYDSKLMKTLADLVTVVTVAVTEGGPIQISYVDKVINYAITYALSPRVVA